MRSVTISRLSLWLNIHYNRIMDMILFFGFLVVGLSIAYGPDADSLNFIQRTFRGIDRRLLVWLFFILPSPIYLLRGCYIWKFAGLAPLAFVLTAISWFVLITPNRAWFVAPVFILSLLRMCIHYIRIIADEYAK